MKKILLADDDPRLRKLVAITLGDDFTILQAADGEETLRIAQQEKPDLILLDIRMPKLDGFEVCSRLKANPLTSGVKVIMLTALSSDSDKIQARKAGADDYFVKPFSPRALLDKVNQILLE